MKIEQRFTATGWFGVVFLFAGPIIAGFAYRDYLSAITRNLLGVGEIYSDPLAAMVVMVFGSILSLASFPMMIIGREFEGFSPGSDGERIIQRHNEPSL